MISGKPVWAETSVTVTPASDSARAEPPVDRISTPRAARNVPSWASPRLSETEINARRTAVSDSADIVASPMNELDEAD